MAEGNIPQEQPKGDIRIASGELPQEQPHGTLDLTQTDYARVEQFSLYNVTSTTLTAGVELDRDGDFFWAVYAFPYNGDVDAVPTKNDISFGVGAAAHMWYPAIGGEFTEFIISGLQPQVKYEIFYYTSSGGNESPVMSKQFIMNEGKVIFGDGIFEVQFEAQFE